MGWIRQLLGNVTDTAATVVATAVGVALAGEAVLALYAWTERSASIFAVGTLFAIAAAGIAGVAGFLFGLPRYTSFVAVPVSKDGEVATGTTTITQIGSATGDFAPSNNLEQVSDWLTKLLLGAGLVQLGAVGRWLGGLVDTIAAALTVEDPTPAEARIVAGSILGIYSVVGFLFVYLSTTLWYRRRLREIENPPPPP
jgi:hypothetical protein